MPPPKSRSDAPHDNVQLIPYKSASSEVIHIGPLRLDVLEDGSRTDRRLSAVHITVPPKTPGPVQHWHQMHDETFLVLHGVATFTSRETSFTAKQGDYVVVPTCAPHTFSNESETEELVMYNTFSPAFYIDYFRLMADMARRTEDGKLTKELAKEAMERYATLQMGTREF
ncbi:hypothetical protein ANO11243_053010 [Dothideomycetidae sp. 11243]|nr:hypothetical protein ANO11243_053010 [fungal sp. No.11243]